MTLISGSTVSSLFIEQFNGKWAGVYLAGVAVGVNIISDGA
jgi:hypothetical protein